MKQINKAYDLVVVGGGLSGMAMAIAAARSGVSVALVHNRPVLGGNASSEMRMHICGADDHMSRPNARETGIIEELQLENKYRNPSASYAVFDSILWEKCAFQPNLELFLNTHMTSVDYKDSTINSITAVQLTSETQYTFTGKIFADATGDGTLGALSGADYRLGREGKQEHGEINSPDIGDRFTMGNSLMFKARDCGKPIPFIKPNWAYSYTEEQLKYRDHSDTTSGYWWIELGGGELSTIDDSEVLRDELLKSVFGVWDHIKNGGEHNADSLDLEWVGFLPGKRESRRLLGDYILNEHDCYNAARFPDGVAYGGWPMDVHVVEGFKSESDNPTVWIHLNDVYEIPYRCLYSRNIHNLMLAGRAISCTHMAFASTRVMATCAVAGEAAGVAAAMAVHKGVYPREINNCIDELRQELLRRDCYIPGAQNTDTNDLARSAMVTASNLNADFMPGNVINGISRTVGNSSNCWQGGVGEWLELRWNEPHQLQELSVTFDSNLSREITISINQAVLGRQSYSVPPELMRDYTVELLLGEDVVQVVKVQNNHLRHCVHGLQQVCCDGVRLTIDATNGCTQAKVYEIRAY